MLFSHHLVLVRGGGDLATGVIYRLHKAGFPVVVLELERPLVVRRRVAVATAVLENHITIEDLHAQLAYTPKEALQLAFTGVIPVLVSPTLGDWRFEIRDLQLPLSPPPSLLSHLSSPLSILIDARMAKRNIDTHIGQAPLVIAMGPGFTAGVDCHAVIETQRGHTLGRVIWQGSALPDTGTPGMVVGKGAERVLRALTAGKVNWRVEIGDLVKEGDVIGEVARQKVIAPFDGVLRGLIAPGTEVRSGLKIGDLDPRADVSACFTISDKALAIGGGVLEAVFTFLNSHQQKPMNTD